MRKIVKSLGLLAVVTIVAGCGSPQVATVEPSKEQDFITVMRVVFPSEAVTDTKIVEMGKSSCKTLETGNAWSDIQDGYVSAGLTSAQARLVIEASVRTYCPDFVGDIPA